MELKNGHSSTPELSVVFDCTRTYNYCCCCKGISNLPSDLKLWFDQSLIQHIPSHMYSDLMEESDRKEPPFLARRKRDLGLQFSPALKERILLLAHRVSTTNRYQKNGYKVMTRWYRTGYIMFPQESPYVLEVW